MKLSVVLALLIGTFTLACSAAAPAPVEPTPNIDATVEAKLAQERAVDATVEAKLKEERVSQPTPQPQPSNTPVATATLPPKPTNTSIPNPTNRPKPTPTNTPTVVPTPVLDATYYRLQGIAYQEQWEHELALESFDKAIELNPNASRAYHSRCKSHRYVNDGNLRALADCDKAIEIDGNQADYYFTRASIYGELYLWKLSIQDNEKGLELDSSNDVAHGDIGRHTVYLNQDLVDIENKSDYLEGITSGSNPDNEQLAYWERASSYFSVGQFVNSIEDYRIAIQLSDLTGRNSRDGMLYYNRSLSYHFVHEFDLSKNDAMKACELDKGFCVSQGPPLLGS